MVIRSVQIAGLAAIVLGVGLLSFLPHSVPAASITGGILALAYGEYLDLDNRRR